MGQSDTDADGNVSFSFVHACDYVIVVDRVGSDFNGAGNLRVCDYTGRRKPGGKPAGRDDGSGGDGAAGG